MYTIIESTNASTPLINNKPSIAINKRAGSIYIGMVSQRSPPTTQLNPSMMVRTRAQSVKELPMPYRVHQHSTTYIQVRNSPQQILRQLNHHCTSKEFSTSSRYHCSLNRSSTGKEFLHSTFAILILLTFIALSIFTTHAVIYIARTHAVAVLQLSKWCIYKKQEQKLQTIRKYSYKF